MVHCNVELLQWGLQKGVAKSRHIMFINDGLCQGEECEYD